jgi:hypothetical protein
MIGQEFKIVFWQDKACLTADRQLTFEQLGLPSFAKTFKVPAFFTIKVLRYIENENRLFCEILSYQVGETEFGHNQKMLADKLNRLQNISLKSIDTTALMKMLAGISGVIRPIKNETGYSKPIQPTDSFRQPNRIEIKETFYVPIKNVRFKLGGVAFNRRFKQHKNTIEFTIPNHDIREEFDAVKYYFANVLRSKKIEVTVNIEIVDNELSVIEAQSSEIEKIDKQLIEQVKYEFLKSMTRKKTNIEIDKSLFDMDEYLNTFAEDKINSNIFYSNDKDLFEDLLTISNTKHYKHLKYLSSRHAHDIMKLKLVHKPFSFIFLIQGSRNYHVVWETLDTKEATYVWHIAKDINVIKTTLRKIEDNIKVIKVHGKRDYLSSAEDAFTRIYHDYSNHVDGFVKWKGELESILT